MSGRKYQPKRICKQGAPWTPERRQQVFDLWRQGLSASQISETLGGVTRNSVIGIVHRAGLCRTDAERRTIQTQNARIGVLKKGHKPKPPPRVRVIAERQTFVEPPPRPPSVIIDARKFTPILGAEPVPFGSKGCKWPVGDDEDGSMLCCGRTRDDGSPYCPEHRAAGTSPTPKASELVRSLRRYA